MIVAIIDQTSPAGQVPVTTFVEAVDEAAGVAQFIGFHPGFDPADWLGWDTGWPAAGGVIPPAPTMQWDYAFDTPGLVQVDKNTLEVCHMLMLDTQTTAITQDGSWQNLYRFVLNPTIICAADRFVMRFRFEYRSTGGNPKLRLTEDGVGWGQEALLDLAGWTTDAVRIGGTPAAGMHTYILQGDRDGASLFEMRGVLVELAAKT